MIKCEQPSFSNTKRVLLVCISRSFVISSSQLGKGKGKGEIIDSKDFWVDLTVICSFTGSFLSCFGEAVLTDPFCEGTEPGSKFRLKDDFLITVSIKWWRPKAAFKETWESHPCCFASLSSYTSN